MNKFINLFQAAFTSLRLGKRTFGLIGQVFAFGSMMLPIFSRNFEALAFLLIVSAFANFAVIPFSIACGHIVPSLKSAKRAQIAIQGAIFFPIMMLLIAWGVYYFFGIYFGTYFSQVWIYSASFTCVQAFYAIVLAVLVRGQDEESVYVLRFRYGLLLLVGTFCAILFVDNEVSLVIAYILATAISAVTLRDKSGRNVVIKILSVSSPPGRVNLFLLFDYSRKNISIILGNMIATGAFQITVVSINQSGLFSAVWAVTLRIVGGAGTTAAQLIAPTIEGQFSQYIRNNKYKFALDTQISAVRLGLLVGFCTCVAVLVGCSWVAWGSDLPMMRSVVFLCFAFLFAFSVGIGSIFSKFPGLSGVGDYYLGYAAAKIGFASIALYAFDEVTLISSLSCIEFLYQLALFLTVRFELKGRSRNA